MSSLKDFMLAQSFHKKSDSKIYHNNNNNNLKVTNLWLLQSAILPTLITNFTEYEIQGVKLYDMKVGCIYHYQSAH